MVNSKIFDLALSMQNTCKNSCETVCKSEILNYIDIYNIKNRCNGRFDIISQNSCTISTLKHLQRSVSITDSFIFDLYVFYIE